MSTQFLNLFGGIFSGKSAVAQGTKSRRRPGHTRRSTYRSLSLEGLERRELMTASPLVAAMPATSAAPTALVASANPTNDMKVLVPAYFYPTASSAYPTQYGAWDNLAAAAKNVQITAILNPDSGPGTAIDPNYVAAVDKLQAAGGQVIGYVHTSYADGTVPLATVEAEINEYRSWYHVNGIFVDEMSSDSNTQHLQYYEAIDQYAHSLQSNWTVVGNPGMLTTQDYAQLPVADVLVNYENDTGYSSFTPPSWQQNYSAQHFANIVDNVATVSAMQTDVNLAAHRDTGYLYVTNLDEPNPYDALPSYWNQFISAVETTPMQNGVAKPAAPTNVVATTASSSQINLSWNAVAGTNGYLVFEKTATGSWTEIKSLVAGQTSLPVTGLSAGVTYSFEVEAYNTAGSSVSSVVSATTKVNLPSTPTNVAVKAVSTTESLLSWSPVAGATSYDIYQWTGSAWKEITSTKSTSDYLTGEVHGTTYYFYVAAANSAGVGTGSAYVSIRV